MAVATDRFLSVEEVKALTGWSSRTLYRYQFEVPEAERFPRWSFGKAAGKADTRRWRRSLVEDWIRRQERAAGVVA
jgi:predicted DNA-binding transcriptional regulator AlpA